MSKTNQYQTIAEEQNKNHRKGIISSIIFHALLLLLLWFFGLPYLDPPPPDSGILVNLGFSETGIGDTPPETINKTEEVVQEVTPPEPVVEAEEVQEEVLTQETEITETIVEKVEEQPKVQPKEKPKEVEKKVQVPVETVPKEVEKEQPKINQKAMFKGRESTQDKEGSEGISKGTGDQGKEWGSDQSKNYGDGNGLGDSGIGFSLGGRKHIALPKPNDNSQAVGTVVIRIKVDKKGNVIDASYQAKGSNTTNSTLVQAAIQAAKKSKFEADLNASEEQFGTITYHFKVE